MAALLFEGVVRQFPLIASSAIFRYLETSLSDPQNAWLLVCLLGVYWTIFRIVRLRRQSQLNTRVSHRDISLAALVGISLSGFILNSKQIDENTQCLAVILAGVTLGSFASLDTSTRHGIQYSILSLQRFVALLIIFLVVASIYKKSAQLLTYYHGRARPTGPWENPNIYGLLMGVGVVLATGMAIQGRMLNKANQSVRAWLITGTWIAAIGATSIGLWKSYSRGGWLATMLGLMFLIIRLPCSPKSTLAAWLRRNICPLVLIATAIVAIGFLQVRHSKIMVANRVLSVANINDFSWRNRIIALEGSLQMMIEKPWFGFGWNQAEAEYDHYYRPPKTADAMAIEMNDYFMLGSSLGIPALVCFFAYIWMSLTKENWGWGGGSKINGTSLESRKLDWLKSTCRAGAIILLVGFWFDGGLFKMATAAPFWLLLEFGIMNR
jgi:O-antigen ligase